MKANVELTGAARRFIAQRPATEGSEVERRVRGGDAAETTSALIAKWERLARRKLFDATNERDEMGRRLIEHGAMCYFNCAQDLKKALVDLEPLISTTEGEHRK